MEIENYEHVILIQNAVYEFYKDNHYYPVSLDELVPKFIDKLPEIGKSFSLIYEIPYVYLNRKTQKYQ
jgi:hypothetical protein